jgi:hypothetical protein
MQNKTLYFMATKIVVNSFTWTSIITSVFALFGCSFITSNEKIRVNTLNFPKANYDHIISVDGKLLAFITDDLRYIQEGDQAFSKLDLPSDPACDLSTRYIPFGTLPDGRLELWKDCHKQPKAETSLFAYEWEAGTMEEIANDLPLGSNLASWNPDGTRGIVYLYSGFSSGTLYWVWKDGFGPLDLTINSNGLSWNVSDDFPDFRGADRGLTGDVERADWSPDGQSIAFFASPEAIGKIDAERFYVEHNIYIMDSVLLKPQLMLSNIHFPGYIEWSPDSKYIAFTGQYGSSKQDGIWLYSLDTDSVIKIAKGRFRGILWAPEGKSLIAIRCQDTNYCPQIEEYGLTAIMQP